jgi:hypothetical protein
MMSISEMTSTSEVLQVLPASAAGKAMATKGLEMFLVAVKAKVEEAKVL